MKELKYCFFILIGSIVFNLGVFIDGAAHEEIVTDQYITGEVVKVPILDITELGIKVHTEVIDKGISTIDVSISEKSIGVPIVNGDVQMSLNLFSLDNKPIILMPDLKEKETLITVAQGYIFRISYVSRYDVGKYKKGVTYLFDLVDY